MLENSRGARMDQYGSLSSTWRTLVTDGQQGGIVPRKVRDLIRNLKKAGFVDRGGKGSHRNFVHPGVRKPVTALGAGR
jgi:predicted RNA binding protein YcfA (HicA-like mRNA interferase family)